MKKIRWGIVGPGCIAEKFASAVKNVDCAELTAVASRSVEKAQQFADKHSIANVFTGYEAMAVSDAVDAVYISTAHPFHLPCAELFLNSHKHVLCEKPLCVNSAQGKRLKAAAAENGVFLMEAMWTRFLPAVMELQRIASDGEIGKVMGLEADFCYSCEAFEDPKLFDNSLAGGSLLDVGVYGLHFASLFLGNKPVSVTSQANIVSGVDRHMSVLLKYASGAVASITSAISLYKPETAYIYGTNGYICVPKFYGAVEFSVVKNGKTVRYEYPSIGNGFEEEIYEACRCIADGKCESDILPLDETIAVLELMDTIRSQCGIVYPFD